MRAIAVACAFLWGSLAGGPTATRADTSASGADPAAGATSGADAELYRLSLNTGGLEVDQLERHEGQAVGFESSFFLDFHARRANLRLSSHENEFALAFDLRARRMRLRLAGGHTQGFYLRLDGDVALRGKPEIDARLILAVAGRRLTLDLPRVRVGAKWGKEGLETEVLVPLIQGGF